MKTIATVLAVCVLGSLGDDLTIVEKEKGADVVEAVIDILDQSCMFDNDRQMLRRIAKVETDDGEASDTFVVNDADYFGGIWRVSDSMLTTAKARGDLFGEVLETFAIDLSTLTARDLLKPLHCGLVARIWIDSSLNGGQISWDEDSQANYWANTYHHFTDSPDPQSYINVIAALETGCEVPRADLVFVLDGSGSIGSINFQTMLTFVVDVVDTFDIAEDGVRVGVIKYSKNSKTEFYLGEINDKLLLKTEVQRIIYEQGGTNTAAALDDMREMFSDKGRADGVPRIGIVMTDGKSNDPDATFAAADKVHEEKLTVFAIGVGGGAVMEELRAIGSDPDCVHVHLLGSFSDIAPFTSQIQSQACKAPAELDPGSDFEGSVGTGKRVFFKLKIKVNGATIKLKMRSGGGRLFVSFKARSPGRAVFKYQLRVDSSAIDGDSLFIPFPDDLSTAADAVEAFVALMGDGIGEANDFTLSTFDGDQSGVASLKPGALIVMLTSAILALIN